jgi:hypothetical protein
MRTTTTKQQQPHPNYKAINVQQQNNNNHIQITRQSICFSVSDWQVLLSPAVP